MACLGWGRVMFAIIYRVTKEGLSNIVTFKEKHKGSEPTR